jgi:hypothetical protein
VLRSCHAEKLKLGLTVATYTARNVKEAIVSPAVGILSQAVGACRCVWLECSFSDGEDVLMLFALQALC